MLDRDGEEARVVGGAVRNALLGEPIHEFDIATTAVPEEVIRRATAAGFKPVPTGIEHGTITVVIVDGTPFEVTTLREDIETFGRHAKVRFGRDWRADAERRDFTINALSVARRRRRVSDYVGGPADLAARRVRFIGEAATRIAEDYLRILRFFRFHAFYGEGTPDPTGLHAAILARDGLGVLSRERVRMELMKLMLAPHAGSHARGHGGSRHPRRGARRRALSGGRQQHDEGGGGVRPLQGDPVHRLGALGAAIPEDAERLWQRLRLSNAEHERIASMADAWWRVDPAHGEQAARALINRLGLERFVDRVLLAWARSQAGADDVAWHASRDASEVVVATRLSD